MDTKRTGGLIIIRRIQDTSKMGVQLSEPWSEEVFVHSDGAIFHLETATGNSGVEQTRADMLEVANAVRPRDSDEIPSGAGTCLKDMFFAMPPGNEDAAVILVSPGDNPPISLEIGTSVRQAGGKPVDLLALDDKRGTRIQISGFEGRELHTTGNQTRYHAIAGQQTSANRPGYQLELRVIGEQRNADTAAAIREDAERVWETVIRSIRLKG